MPYYAHPRETSPESGRVYSTARDAGENKRDGEIVTFVPSETELTAWRDREYAKYDTGTYSRLPFMSDGRLTDRFPDHYVHLSLTKPGLIAYTKTIQHGIEDRHTRVRPGKYFTEYYSGVLTAEQIRLYAAEITAESVALSIATSADEIEAAYTCSTGPSSCMDGHHRFRTEHPSRVYAGPDLAVAYTGPLTAVSARAVIWPDQKLYYRTYGHTSLIERLLQSAGYTERRLVGARVRAIRCDQGLVMPYVDGISNGTLSDCGTFVTLDDSGKIDVQNTSGIARIRGASKCDHCGDDNDSDDCELCTYCQEHTYTCEDCGDRIGEDDGNCEDGTVYCNRCYNRRFTSCHHCDETISQDDARSVNGDDYCDDCYGELFTCCTDCEEDVPCDEARCSEETGEAYCAHCWGEYDRTCVMSGCEIEWNEVDVFDFQDRRARTQSGTETLCKGCAENYCPTCECTEDDGLDVHVCPIVADAESDGFGIAWYDPDGTPWQLVLPIFPVLAPPVAVAESEAPPVGDAYDPLDNPYNSPLLRIDGSAWQYGPCFGIYRSSTSPEAA